MFDLLFILIYKIFMPANKKREKKTIRKQQIIDAICSIILKDGSEYVTIRNISKEINLTEAAIYRHYTSKKEIFLDLIDFISDLLINDIKKINIKDIDSFDKLYNVFLNQIKNTQARKGMEFLIISEIISLGEKDLNKELSLKINEYVKAVEFLFKSSIENKIIKNDINIEILSKQFFYLLHGLICNWYINNFNFDINESFNNSWDLFKVSLLK